MTIIKAVKISFSIFGFTSEQGVIGYAKSNGQFFISTLLTLLQMKYQNSGESPFNMLQSCRLSLLPHIFTQEHWW
jgi:hypothetical protein